MSVALRRSIRELIANSRGGENTKRQFLVAAIVLIAHLAAMHLHPLTAIAQRDFDEGVYWQTVRAMSEGNALYRDIFYSQPPLFALLSYASYQAGGETLAAARFGVAAVTILGIVGAALLGLLLRGRTSALIGMALTIACPMYLRLSDTLQADAVSAALALLAVALAYMWLKDSEDLSGYMWAGATGSTLALSVLAKLLCITAGVPIALIVLTTMWQRKEEIRRSPFRELARIAFMLMCFILTVAGFLLPFRSAWDQLIHQVITFHLEAGRTITLRQGFGNYATPMMLLGLMALFGAIAAIRERDWRVYPLLAWLLATSVFLARLLPLWTHHLVALVAPLVALSMFGFKDGSIRELWISLTKLRRQLPSSSAVGMFLFLAVLTADFREDLAYYKDLRLRDDQSRAAADLAAVLSANQLVVTDEPFIAGLADRNIPAWLTDPSMVRIKSGYLTLKELEEVSSRQDVRAVLFFSGRFRLPEVAGFEDWISQRFRLQRDYGSGRKLRVR